MFIISFLESWILIFQHVAPSHIEACFPPGAAILLSTHHLDEADVISDTIAVLHQGRLLCQGSPMFLKHHLASGHRLTATSNLDSKSTTTQLNYLITYILCSPQTTMLDKKDLLCLM